MLPRFAAVLSWECCYRGMSSRANLGCYERGHLWLRLALAQGTFKNAQNPSPKRNRDGLSANESSATRSQINIDESGQCVRRPPRVERTASGEEHQEVSLKRHGLSIAVPRENRLPEAARPRGALLKASKSLTAKHLAARLA
jgi:hypothetical protein